MNREPSPVRREVRIEVSVILPAKNEATSLGKLLPEVRRYLPSAAEIIVVDDGSTDSTPEIAAQLGARVISHPYSMGNGAAVKTGTRAARGEFLVFMDADGQHDPATVRLLLAELQRFDMVVGSRSPASQANLARRLANGIYNRLASYITGQKVEDLTSGFRAVHGRKFREFLYLLPNGFSYPTTSTIAFFRAGYSVKYVPIEAGVRAGRSHIRPLRDGLRFLLIIFKISTLYSPLKLFLPIAAGFFSLGLSYYLFTYITTSRFTNMSALMLSTSVLVFLIGLVSEQITQLLYRPTANEEVMDSRLQPRPGNVGERVRPTGT